MPAAEHGAQGTSQLTEQSSAAAWPPPLNMPIDTCPHGGIKTDSKGLETRLLACVFGQLEQTQLSALNESVCGRKPTAKPRREYAYVCVADTSFAGLIGTPVVAAVVAATHRRHSSIGHTKHLLHTLHKYFK